MDRLKDYLPESCYSLKNMSMNDVKYSFKKNQTVIGYVLSIDETEEVLNVRLGDGIMAKLPFSEATIYPLTYSKTIPEFKLPFQISSLYGKIICSKIINIENDDIVLSRKKSMLEAFEVLKDKPLLPFSVSHSRSTMVYGDIGYGLNARIFIRDLCKSRIQSTNEICNEGDCFYVKILWIDELKRFNVSYKETFPEYSPENYNRGDTITVRITFPVDNKFSGFFAYINPQTCGILDYNINLPVIRYGDEVECMISQVTPSGLRLKFIKLVKHAAC